MKKTSVYLGYMLGLLFIGSVGCSNGGTKGGIVLRPVAPLDSFTASKGGHPVTLSWVNPPDTYAITILYSTQNAILTYDLTAGHILTQNMLASTTTLTHNTAGIGYGDSRIYYSIFAISSAGNISTVSLAQARPGDTTAPSDITGFTVASGNHEVVLTWMQPLDSDLVGYTLAFIEAPESGPTPPIGGADITRNIPAGASGTQNYTLTGLTNGIRYRLILEPYDLNGNTGNITIQFATPTVNVAP